MRFTETYDSDRWPAPLVSHSVLRFLDPGLLAGFLSAAGLTVVEQYGDWDGRPPAPGAPEIITVATPTA
ncbi:hypothetical protein ACPCBC_06670 [Streptomyces incarnatus]